MKNLVQYLILAAVVGLFFELIGYIGSRLLVSQGIVLDPFTVEGYEEYLAQRDPVLGWPSPTSFGSGEFDRRGSRVVPSFPDDSSASCVALFGDSFTWGDEVAPDDAYGNVLAQRIGCRVANYGVGGYGTDQAVLRYFDRIEDPAPIVVLGHYSDNVMRNVNQLRDLTSPSRFGFKPRFVRASDGSLDLIPLPRLSAEEFVEVTRRTEELLPEEYFVPDRLGGPVSAGFPHSITLLRAVFHFRVQARLRGVPSYAPFYDEDHPSDAVGITRAIMNQFVVTARQRGQVPIIVLMPDEKDLRLLAQGSPPAYNRVLQWLREQSIPSPDVAEGMLIHLGERDPCELFVRCSGRSHYNEEGYATLAELVYAQLVEDHLLAATEAGQLGKE